MIYKSFYISKKLQLLDFQNYKLHQISLSFSTCYDFLFICFYHEIYQIYLKDFFFNLIEFFIDLKKNLIFLDHLFMKYHHYNNLKFKYIFYNNTNQIDRYKKLNQYTIMHIINTSNYIDK